MAGFLEIMKALQASGAGEWLGKAQDVKPAGRIAGLLEADPVSTQYQNTGEYAGKEQARPAQKPAGLIGSDPVATQEQSRVSPKGAGRTFYANTAGDVGTSVPKGSGTAGVYDSASAAAVQEGKAGLLSRIGQVAKIATGPVATGAQLLTHSPDAGDSSDQLTPEQREAIYPGSAADAQKYAQHIQDLAKQAAPQQPQGPQGAGLLMAGAKPQAAPQAAPTHEMPTAVKPVTVSTETPNISTGQARQIDTRRQAIEQTATKQLQSNTLSRTKAAEQVVQADCQRAGVQPTPEEHKEMVQKEVGEMRGMDTPTLGKYLSYALMGLGAVAALTDKTGQGATNLVTSGINAYQKEKAQAFATAKFNAEYRLKASDQDRKNRDTDSNIQYRADGTEIKRDTLDNTKEYRAGLLDQGDRKIDQGDRRLDQGDISLSQKDRALSQGDIGLSLKARGLNQKDVSLGYEGTRVGIAQQAQDTNQKRLGLMADRIKSQNAKDAAAIAKGPTVKIPDMSQKDQVVAAKSELKDRGFNSTDGFAQQYAAEKRSLRKSLPGASEDELSKLALKRVKPAVKEGSLWFDDTLELSQ